MDVKPEDLRRHLAAGGSKAPDASESASPAEQDVILESISASYFVLRRGLAILALLFPVALWLGAGIDELQRSISAYYHYRETGGGSSPYGSGEMRDVFVGVLWAVGAFLVFYKGYSWKENWALNVAGVAAVAIALLPTDWPGESVTLISKVHFAAGILFFLAIAYVCLFRSGDTLELIEDQRVRRRFKRSYAILGALMVVLPLAVYLLHLLSDQFHLVPEDTDESYVVIGIEVAAIWVFGVFWLVKSGEIAILRKQ